MAGSGASSLHDYFQLSSPRLAPSLFSTNSSTVRVQVCPRFYSVLCYCSILLLKLDLQFELQYHCGNPSLILGLDTMLRLRIASRVRCGVEVEEASCSSDRYGGVVLNCHGRTDELCFGEILWGVV